MSEKTIATEMVEHPHRRAKSGVYSQETSTEGKRRAKDVLSSTCTVFPVMDSSNRKQGDQDMIEIPDDEPEAYDEWGVRCHACGCFLGSVDTSTESGYDFELVCNNDKCRTNQPMTKAESDYLGKHGNGCVATIGKEQQNEIRE